MMDNLGVAMNATTIEAYALAKGLDFAWNSATNAEKAEIAMQMFLKKPNSMLATSQESLPRPSAVPLVFYKPL